MTLHPAAVAVLVTVGCGATGSTGGGLGESGEPVTLTVGYYSESWSG
jgi:hypothetical protein